MSEEQQLTSLNDILNQSETPAEETAQSQDAGETGEAQQTDETAQSETEKGDKTEGSSEDAPPASKDKDDGSKQFQSPQEQAAFKMAKEERAKRQELERRLAALEDKQNQNSQQNREEEEDPDFLLDPEAAYKKLEKRIDQKEWEQRSSISQEVMRSLHEDYDDIEAVFIDAANKNPYLGQQLRAHPNPAKFAYEQGKALKFQEEVGVDPKKYEADLREKLRKEIEAELKAETVKANKDAADAQKPNSLADAPNAANREGPKWAGPTPLSDILK